VFISGKYILFANQIFPDCHNFAYKVLICIELLDLYDDKNMHFCWYTNWVWFI